MEFVNYSIEHDSKYGYITVQAKTDKGIPFSYAFSEDHTIREIHNKLVEISEDIDKGKYEEDWGMLFNDWKITINGKGSHDVVTNEDTLLILQDYQHVEIALKIVNDTIQIKSLGYGEDVSINPTTKEITIKVTNLLDDE